MTDAELLAMLEGRTIASLTDTERQYLRSRVVPAASFSEEQRNLLKDWWLLLPDDRVAEFESMNIKPNIKASWVTDLAGNKLLPADLMTDYDDGDTWGHLRPILQSLTLKKVDSSGFPVPESSDK